MQKLSSIATVGMAESCNIIENKREIAVRDQALTSAFPPCIDESQSRTG